MLTQRVIGKESGPNGSAREVLSLSLRQTAALSKPFTTATGTSSTFAEHKFTPLDATLRINPYQSITVDATARFGNESKQLDQTSLSANLIGSGKRAGEYLSLTWFATYRDPRTNAGDSSQFRIGTGIPLWNDRLRLDATVNYPNLDLKFVNDTGGWRGFMFALGCIQSLSCANNDCPAGIATQDPRLRKGLFVENKLERVFNYHHAVIKRLKNLMATAGVASPEEFHPGLIRRVKGGQLQPLDKVLEYIRPGALLKERRVPDAFKDAWLAASADSFEPLNRPKEPEPFEDEIEYVDETRQAQRATGSATRKKGTAVSVELKPPPKKAG